MPPKNPLIHYLAGNEDMHLKNFSLISREDKIELSPAYDLLNTTIALDNPQEEFALPINGKKRNMTSRDLLEYWGRERLQLSEKVFPTRLKKFALCKMIGMN